LPASTDISLELFDRLFDDTIKLIERTIAYLERESPGDREPLSVGAKLVFATESMRLTSQLMQCMAWLLARKALQRGEITEFEAASPTYRLGTNSACGAESLAGTETLPRRFRDLLAEGRSSYLRIARLDHFAYGGPATGRLLGGQAAHETITIEMDSDVLPLAAQTIAQLRAQRAQHKRQLIAAR
jgi:regulator of CtrA degradation